MRSRMAWVTGAAHGANFSSSMPGKKQSERPHGTFDRVRTMRPMRRLGSTACVG